MSGSGIRAFTLIELMVVIATVAILAAFLLPVLSKGRDRALTVACMNNLKQLQGSWQLYVTDNSDSLPPNNYVAAVYEEVGTNYPSLYLDKESWCTGIAQLDRDATNIQRGVLYHYNKAEDIYRCPADRSEVREQPGMLRQRSYNMSLNINSDAVPRSFRRSLQIRNPPSSDLFVFIDTHEDAIWDPTFGIFGLNHLYKNYWLDLPADRHNRGVNMSFADGHVEHWRWRAPKRFLGFWQPAYSEEDLLDLRRLQRAVEANFSPGGGM